MNLRLALAQINPVVGDLDGNTKQIVDCIKRAKSERADIVLFPETAITGYPCGALYDQQGFVRRNKELLLEQIAPLTDSTLTAVVGFVDPKGVGKDGFPIITSAAAVIQNGKVLHIHDKILLANEHHHEDRRYFVPGDRAEVVPLSIKGETVRIGIAVCEDAWSHVHERDIVAELKAKGAQLILSPNQSYFHYGKQQIRRSIFGEHAKKHDLAVAAVNSSGVGDIVKNVLIYDGGSLCFQRGGGLLAELKRFDADFQVVEIDLKQSKSGQPASSKPNKHEEIFNALVFEQRELFRVLGIKKAQVHLSGGVDSAVVAALAVEAMGGENCVFISNPAAENGELTRSFAKHVADALKVELFWNHIDPPCAAVCAEHEKAFGAPPSLGAKSSIQAVLRTVQGLAASHAFRSGIVATGNHTEIVLGWASFHDIGSIGVHAPIGDLTKTEVFALADYINHKYGKEIIPKPLFDGSVPPMAELPDAKEDPFNYYIVSGLCAEMIRNRHSVRDLVNLYREKKLSDDSFPRDPKGRTIYEICSEEEFKKQAQDVYRRSRGSVFKSAQAAPNVVISPRSRGFSSRETIINHYSGEF